jgi:hypothetical protein
MDLRRLILRTLNDNQLLILNGIQREKSSLTKLLKRLSTNYKVPLSTLKLNARILRELNLITYGSIHEKKNAGLLPLGNFVIRLLKEEYDESSIQLNN